MQRLFGELINNEIKLKDEDIHHLINVKRYSVGEKLEVVCGDKIYLCEVSSLNPLVIKIVKTLNNQRELKTKISLAFALLKGDHNSLILEKCTELGVTDFYPFTCDRCVIKVDKKDDSNRNERFLKIVKGASEQSRRDNIPTVSKVMSFNEILNLNIENKIIAFEGLAGSSKTLLSYLNEHNDIKDIMIIVGPEGGFTDKEISLSNEKNITQISLGKTILRGETACIASSAIAASVLENHE